MEWVKVRDSSSGQETYFFANSWLDEAHGLAAVLQPGVRVLCASTESAFALHKSEWASQAVA